MRRHARRLLLFVAILFMQFFLFEAGLRTWGTSEAAPAFQGLFTPDPVIGYRLKPRAQVRFATSEFDNEIAINNAGVRDSEDIGPKPSGEKRILILGDSLVLSVQVPFEQTFSELLERRLNASRGTAQGSSNIRYRVINAGVQGYGPVEELLFFRTALKQLEPDLVLTTVFVGNDAEEALTSAAKLSEKRATTDVLRDSATTWLRRTVRRSMVLQVLRLRVLSATERLRGFKGPPEAPLQSYAAKPAPRIAEGLDIARDCIRQLASEAGAAGARTGIVLMPARFQVDDVDYGHLREAVAAQGGELVRVAATQRFATALSPLALPITDLLDPLRRALPGPPLFFELNVHLTPRGHTVVADHLAQFAASVLDR
jgi:lysophospholipase L1-like esterase